MTDRTQSYILQEYPAGTKMFRQGDKGGWVYAIQSGTVEIRREFRDQDCLLAVLGPGDFFGEMSVINERPRCATAIVREPTQLLGMQRGFFMELFHKDAEIAGRLARIMSARLDHANRWLEVLLFARPDERVVHSLRLLVEEQVERDKVRRGAVYLPFTLRELADRAGVTSDQAVDVVERLAGDGLITSASAAEIDGPGYVVAEAGALLDFLGVSGQATDDRLVNASGSMYSAMGQSWA
ncbi:Crp/Fnr family transcriptional regulator [Haliangium ochraceum]|uniref:Putative transcriptional regulator, Crp/Fnr family n=1 Tax=Haliangium ochraceum (strain DSM 14365 / JCM 11303 / SMP-2) TaxID=502025 RepID=D0LUE5_HALO1|nr:Crp/Fnr family transcriptional regulator [Haliangium ochraceum]ACY19268.1 putative transcriptional regulator, Crp/Fnr family [Haliangium ochraceum DSM 14365]